MREDVKQNAIPRSAAGPRHPLARHVFIAAAVFCVLASFSVWMWRTKSRHDRANLTAHLNYSSDRIARPLEQAIDQQLQPLRGLARDARTSRFATEQEFTRAAGALGDRIGDYAFVAWVDEGGTCRYVFPHDAAAADLIEADLHEHPDWAGAIGRARALWVECAGETGHARDGEPRSNFVIPVTATVNGEPAYAGAVIGTLRLRPAVSKVIDDHAGTRLALELRDGETVLLHGGARPAIAGAKGVIERLAVLDRSWELRVKPTGDFLAVAMEGRNWILFGGLAVSALAAVAILQGLRHRWLQAEQDRRHVQALESLNRITAAISARLGSSQELLDQLAGNARALAGMEMASVLLLDDERKTLRVVSSSGFPRDLRDVTFTPADLPLTWQSIREARIITLEDAEHADPPRQTFNRALMHELRLRSAMAIPLRIGQRTIGALMLTDTRPARFNDRELRLAELLGSQVAVTLANNELYEQMSESLRAQHRLLDQREKLAAVTVAVYQASSLDESLKRVVGLAPSALGVDVCLVDLIIGDVTGSRMVIAAATPPFDKHIGYRYEGRGTYVHNVIVWRQMKVVEDSVKDAATDPWFVKNYSAGGVVYLPLFQADGAPLGTLRLVRHAPGGFSDEQLRLAQVFASRAAAAIESARLHQRLKRDAETRAMLLRELNHRVKNNLSGIVGLLSTQPHELSDEARRWIGRVVERITVMGRAHELFVGGPQRVSLAGLIDQLLPTLAVVKPAGVRFEKELNGVQVTLATERAVALAMVLHELCYNAMVHGTGDDGNVTIRAHSDGTRVTVDVIDDGRGYAAAPMPVGAAAAAANESAAAVVVASGIVPPAQSFEAVGQGQGWGLRLVYGLVARELRGKFAIRHAPEGGTVASVEFPVSSDE